MKIYIICEQDYEYNDECYDVHNGYHNKEAYRKKENAEARCEELNKKFVEENERVVDYDDKAIKPYKVIEVEVLEENIEQSYEELRKQRQELAKKSEELFKADLLKSAKLIFDKYSELKSFGWQQSTPSWNDGDPCYFHTYIDGESIFVNGSYNYSCEDWESKAQDEISTMLCRYSSDDMESLGDGYQITINRNLTITKEGYYE